MHGFPNVLHVYVRYSLFPSHDNAPNDAVKLCDTFVVAWDCDDGISGQYIEWLNGDSGEYGNYTPCEWMILTPSTNRTYKHSDWGEQFFTWIDNGFRIFNQLITRE